MSKEVSPEVVALIPARGGSTGIRNKNLLPIMCKPLVAYSIEHAQKAKAVKRVFVSSDSPAIRKVANEFGAETIERPDDLSGDRVILEPVMAHALEYMNKTLDYWPRYMVVLLPTSPNRNPANIDLGVGRLEETGADTWFTVSRVLTNVLWSVDRAGRATRLTEGEDTPYRQDVPEKYRHNGNILIVRLRPDCEVFTYGETVLAHELHPLEAMEIDEIGDIYPVRLMMHALAALRTSTLPTALERESLKGGQGQ